MHTPIPSRGAPVYSDLERRFARLDARHTRYRFDLDADIPWPRLREPGLYCGPRLLERLGVDVDGLRREEEAFALFQWAFALSTCLEFIELERGVCRFFEDELFGQGAIRSAHLLFDEEEKHIAMFVRVAEHLREQQPALAAELERSFRVSRIAPPFEDAALVPNPVARHYAFWLSTLFFEDYTIYLHEELERERDLIQPAWLAVHKAHRREEEQHVVTDVAYMDACRLNEADRVTWSKLSWAWLAEHFGRFSALDAPEQLVRQRFPALAFAPTRGFPATKIHDDVLVHRSFRKTRTASPYLARLAQARAREETGTRPSLSAFPASSPRPRGKALRGEIQRARAVARRSMERLRARLHAPLAWLDAHTVPPVERFSVRELFDGKASVELPQAARAETEDREAVASSPSSAAIEAYLDNVREAWALALEMPLSHIDLDTPFTSLGGDSMKAAALHTALEDRLGRPLGLDILLECRTVRECAGFLARGAIASEDRAAPVVSPRRHDDAIAIIRVAARFPGATDLEQFWELLARGGTAFREAPLDRFDAKQLFDPSGMAPGKSVCVRGSFLDDIASFDPEAFGLTEVEARFMDPQQRLFLELAADALESAGPTPGRVGVFASAGWNEYLAGLLRDPTHLGSAAALGNLGNMIAARVSQKLGLRGPAYTVDAACASSLVALHLACRSLLEGECDAALAGGAQLNLGAATFVLFSQAGVLSRAQSCRPFSEHADGFVPGEGAGVVLLKRLGDALRDGDRVLAVVRGSAINNDGGALSGMAPSPQGQVEVLRAAYRAAGVDPTTVSYLEAHGTGTLIGDAVEVQALAQVVGAKRDAPCALGSVKSNLGHLLSTAGIASVIKVVLALEREQLPPLAGPLEPSRRIDFAALGFEPLRSLKPWVSLPGSPRRAGITALGIGGTNCHVVLEEPPPRVAHEHAQVDVEIVVLSAPSEAELSRVATEVAHRLEDAAPHRVDAHVAALHARAHRFPWRRAVVGPRRDLPALVRASGHAHKADVPPHLAFVFSGPGAQHVDMARPLFEGAPAFRAAFERCERVLDGHLPHALRAYLYDQQNAATGALDGIDVSQPVVFSVGYALACWLSELGVRPEALIGHSAGEYAALCVAGALSLEEALLLVTRRGALMRAAPEGGMAAVFAGEARVREALEAGAVSIGEHLDVAAVNEPGQVVLSGSSEALARALRLLEERHIASHKLSISCAAHSPLMRDAQRGFAPFAQGARLEPLTIPLYSTCRGGRLDVGARITSDYLIEHIRATVRFRDAIAAAARDGIELFLEVGGSGGLVPCMEQGLAQVVAEEGRGSHVVPLLRRAQPTSWEPPLAGLGRLVELGVPVDLRRLSPGGARSTVETGYPYRRRLFWVAPLERAFEASTKAVSDVPVRDGERGLEEVRSWCLFAAHEPHIRDHLARGEPIAPGARLMELLLEALGPSRPVVVDHLVTVAPLIVGDAPTRLRARRSVEGGFLIEGHTSSEEEWTLHLTAQPASTSDASLRDRFSLRALRGRCTEPMDPSRLYERLARTGLTYGPRMRPVKALYLGNGELLARLEIADEDEPRSFHPAIVDGAMQSIAALVEASAMSEDALFLGFSVGRLTVERATPVAAWAHVRLLAAPILDARSLRAEVTLFDDQEERLVHFDDVGLKRVEPPAVQRRSPVRPRPRTVALLRPASSEPSSRVRRALEDSDVFVLETSLPRSEPDVQALFERLGPVDSLLALLPSSEAPPPLTRALRALLRQGTDVVVAAPQTALATLALAPLRVLPFDPEDGPNALVTALLSSAMVPLVRAQRRQGDASLSVEKSSASEAGPAAVRAFLHSYIGSRLGLPPASIDARAPFPVLGLDSLMAVEAVRGLERRFGLRLHPTLLFEHQTIDAVVAVLGARLSPLSES